MSEQKKTPREIADELKKKSCFCNCEEVKGWCEVDSDRFEQAIQYERNDAESWKKPYKIALENQNKELLLLREENLKLREALENVRTITVTDKEKILALEIENARIRVALRAVYNECECSELCDCSALQRVYAKHALTAQPPSDVMEKLRRVKTLLSSEFPLNCADYKTCDCLPCEALAILKELGID